MLLLQNTNHTGCVLFSSLCGRHMGGTIFAPDRLYPFTLLLIPWSPAGKAGVLSFNSLSTQEWHSAGFITKREKKETIHTRLVKGATHYLTRLELLGLFDYTGLGYPLRNDGTWTTGIEERSGHELFGLWLSFTGISPSHCLSGMGLGAFGWTRLVPCPRNGRLDLAFFSVASGVRCGRWLSNWVDGSVLFFTMRLSGVLT